MTVSLAILTSLLPSTPNSQPSPCWAQCVVLSHIGGDPLRARNPTERGNSVLCGTRIAPPGRSFLSENAISSQSFLRPLPSPTRSCILLPWPPRPARYRLASPVERTGETGTVNRPPVTVKLSLLFSPPRWRARCFRPRPICLKSCRQYTGPTGAGQGKEGQARGSPAQMTSRAGGGEGLRPAYARYEDRPLLDR